MPRRIIRRNFLSLPNGISFSFNMTDHLNKQLNEDDILRKICETISEGLKEKFPIWAKLKDEFGRESEYRFFAVSKNHGLYQCLDKTSRDRGYNVLIFQWIGNDITITHFGPFGKAKEATFNERWDRITGELNEIKREIREMKSSGLPEEKKQAEITEKLARVRANYVAILENIKEEIIEFKSRHPSASTGILLSGSMGKVVGKTVQYAGTAGAKSAMKSGMKAGTKAIPLVGFLAGTCLGAYRLAQGDVAGASMEMASGLASCVPGAGTAASLAIDAALVGKDVLKATGDNLAGQVALQYLSERYDNALADYEIVKLVLDTPEFSFQNPETEELVGFFGEADLFEFPNFSFQQREVERLVFDPATGKLRVETCVRGHWQ